MTAQPRVDGVDLIALGRVGIDLYPLEAQVPLKDIARFGRYLGGSPANVSVAAVRHGLSAALITRTGSDPFGSFVVEELARLGVDNRYVTRGEGARTTLAFCELFPPDDFPLHFVRDAIAPELKIGVGDLDLEAIATARAFWATGTGLSQPESAEAHFAAWEARAGSANSILDLDYRGAYWADEADATREFSVALGMVTVAVGNVEECRVAVGESVPHRAADALLDRGVELAVVKQGPAGVLAKTRTESVVVPPTEVAVVNGLGAGDGFGGALVKGLLEGWSIEHTIAFASTAGAIVASRLECSNAMPTTAEVNALLVQKHR